MRRDMGKQGRTLGMEAGDDEGQSEYRTNYDIQGEVYTRECMLYSQANIIKGIAKHIIACRPE